MLYKTDVFNRLMEDLRFPKHLMDLDKVFDVKFSFPHFDIERKGNKVTYAFALAGYSKDCLEAFVEKGNLILKGYMKKDEDSEYIYNGISKRKIDIVLPLPFGDKFTEYSASFEDGILRISFDLEPEKEQGFKLEIK